MRKFWYVFCCTIFNIVSHAIIPFIVLLVTKNFISALLCLAVIIFITLILYLAILANNYVMKTKCPEKIDEYSNIRGIYLVNAELVYIDNKYHGTVIDDLAKNGDKYAYFDLAERYYFGIRGMKKDVNKSIEYYKKAAYLKREKAILILSMILTDEEYNRCLLDDSKTENIILKKEYCKMKQKHRPLLLDKMYYKSTKSGSY